MSTSTKLILEDARRASVRAAFSLGIVIMLFVGLVVGAAIGNDLIGW